MKYLVLCLLLLGAGCVGSVEDTGSFGQRTLPQDDNVVEKGIETDVVFPVENYIVVYKGFAEYIEDRFTGYHVGEDIEVFNKDEEVPVYAIAGGTIRQASVVSGYGGVIVLEHYLDGEIINAIYGHVDLSSREYDINSRVEKGEFLANLGDHESEETDGERKHLHFGLYEGKALLLKGYELDAAAIENWINPTDFFFEHGLDPFQDDIRMSTELVYDGLDIFSLEFEVPAEWDIEYIPSLQSLNIYTRSGSGSARERSQILIRYFDASAFLTLSTVEIYSTEDLTVGQEDYTARRYDIEKKPGVADFLDQPSWRNERHMVTDFRATEGFTRYYVVAANPDFDTDEYEQFLSSIAIK